MGAIAAAANKIHLLVRIALIFLPINVTLDNAGGFIRQRIEFISVIGIINHILLPGNSCSAAVIRPAGATVRAPCRYGNHGCPAPKRPWARPLRSGRRLRFSLMTGCFVFEGQPVLSASCALRSPSVQARCPIGSTSRNESVVSPRPLRL